MYRYCLEHGVVPDTHRCTGRWVEGRSKGRPWRRQRAAVLTRDGYTCWCGAPATEVHHVTDTELRSVCHAHNPRGG